MPELPEVETIRRGLLPQIEGARIVEVRTGDSRVFQLDRLQFQSRVTGQRVLDLQRRGKFLVFVLDHDYCLFHLGMTGQLTFRDPKQPDPEGFLRHSVTGLQRARQHPPDRHTHLQLIFGGGTAIFFRDVRKFGKVLLLAREGGLLESFFARLGLEPLGAEYTRKAFLERLNRRTVRTKSLLLDQSFVAGIGNIYADESLFVSGIHPSRRVHSLRRFEKERLFEAIRQVLEKGIRYGGTSLRDYVNSDGQSGMHQEELLVYGRCGAPCRRCGTAIEKVIISQRSTHFCPHCQPRSGRSPARNLQKSV